MSILTGFKKVKNYILTSSGYQLLSRWTSSQTVEFDDGKTAQAKLGEINGIAKTYVDMKKATDNSMAVSAKAVMEGLENSSALISMTQAEYDALSDEEKTDNNMRAILDANPDVVDAKNVNFDNTNTNLIATNTQSAITELNGKLGNIYISDITSEINTDYVDGSVYVYSTYRTIRVIAKLTAKEDIPAWTHIINNLGWSGINIYFHDVNNQIGINWKGNYMQNTIVVSKNNTFNIDIEGIV